MHEFMSEPLTLYHVVGLLVAYNLPMAIGALYHIRIKDSLKDNYARFRARKKQMRNEE